jgi:hypothetical protein
VLEPSIGKKKIKSVKKKRRTKAPQTLRHFQQAGGKDVQIFQPIEAKQTERGEEMMQLWDPIHLWRSDSELYMAGMQEREARRLLRKRLEWKELEMIYRPGGRSVKMYGETVNEGPF